MVKVLYEELKVPVLYLGDSDPFGMIFIDDFLLLLFDFVIAVKKGLKFI